MIIATELINLRGKIFFFHFDNHDHHDDQRINEPISATETTMQKKTNIQFPFSINHN